MPPFQALIEELTGLFSTSKVAKRMSTMEEWTVLAGILMTRNKTHDSLQERGSSWQWICAASGTSCLNPSHLSTTHSDARFYKIHDSHAEVLVRRTFIL
jgi:Adenosine-deaminase (editase) domain